MACAPGVGFLKSLAPFEVDHPELTSLDGSFAHVGAGGPDKVRKEFSV